MKYSLIADRLNLDTVYREIGYYAGFSVSLPFYTWIVVCERMKVRFKRWIKQRELLSSDFFWVFFFTFVHFFFAFSHKWITIYWSQAAAAAVAAAKKKTICFSIYEMSDCFDLEIDFVQNQWSNWSSDSLKLGLNSLD